jgi:hypothetical protein
MEPLSRIPQSSAVKNITEAQLIAALRKHAGVYVLAARELGCDRANVRARVMRSEKLQALIAEIDAEIGDVAEGVIFDALMKKDRNMAKWYAERKLRGRGYVTRQEQVGADGQPLHPAGGQALRIIVEYVDALPEGEVGDVI